MRQKRFASMTPEPPETEPIVSPSQPLPKSKFSFSPTVLLLSSLLIIFASVAGYFYWQYQHTPDKLQQAELDNLKETISTFVALPEDETPTLATVTDKDKLASQAFFQKAENGDKVLIYTGAGRAILYRPSLKKIVDMTAINLGAYETPQVPTPTETPQVAGVETETPPVEEVTPARVALYNGSTKVGATNTVEVNLKEALPDLTVVTRATAERKDYEQTRVVDLSGSRAEEAAQVASALNGEVGLLPDGEVAPQNADILVIVGNE